MEIGAGFHPEFTGRENIYLNGAILKYNKEDLKRLEPEIIAFAEIEEFIDTPVKYYSTGMYLRLAFSLATAIQPEILPPVKHNPGTLQEKTKQPRNVR